MPIFNLDQSISSLLLWPLKLFDFASSLSFPIEFSSISTVIKLSAVEKAGGWSSCKFLSLLICVPSRFGQNCFLWADRSPCGTDFSHLEHGSSSFEMSLLTNALDSIWNGVCTHRQNFYVVVYADEALRWYTFESTGLLFSAILSLSLCRAWKRKRALRPVTYLAQSTAASYDRAPRL